MADATRMKYILQGLEIFDALNIVKHDLRKQLLIKLKDNLKKPELRFNDIMYMVKLYPLKINSRAFESLMEQLYERILENKTIVKFEHELEVFI